MRAKLAIGAAALLVAPALARAPAAVVVRHYLVRGTDARSIRASLDARRPHDADGVAVDAITHVKFAWRWLATADGGCDLAAVTVSFSATMTLPRLANVAALDPALRARWRRYVATLEAHEAEHVAHAFARRPTVLAAIRGATCATAAAAGRKALAAIAAHDRAFDEATQHGATEGARFP